MKISVITINYNNALGLEQTINSVISQDFNDFEYIVIDGGSTDGSVEIIKKYSDHITFWVSEPDKGIYNAMNKGVAHANGEYVNFMNSGDGFHSTTVLSDIAPTLDCDIVAGKCLTGGQKESKYFSRNITLIDLITDNINHQATFTRTELLKDCPYDESLKIFADWAFAIHQLVLKDKTFKSVNILVANYDNNGVSSIIPDMQQQRLNYIKSILPPRMFCDYMELYQMKLSEIGPYVAPLAQTKYKFQHFCGKLLKYMLKLYHWLF